MTDPPYGAPPYGAPQYGAPLYGAPLAGPARNGMGIAALVLGLLALPAAGTILGGLLLGVLAIVFGLLGWGRVKRGEAHNKGMAAAGIVCGGLGIVLSIALLAFILTSTSGHRLRTCLAQAGNDQAAQKACQSQFVHDLTG